MDSQPDEMELKARGYALEKEGQADEALAIWSDALLRFPSNGVFALRKAVLSLNRADPETALDALDAAAASDDRETYSEQIIDLTRRARSLAASQHRVAAMDAYEAEDYLNAHHHFSRLLDFEPDHPWAGAYLVNCAGYAPNFAERLAKDLPQVPSRLLVTGCGRSGTWLLAAMLSGLEDIDMAEGERHFGHFAFMSDAPVTHIVKRQHDTYKDYHRIPESIRIIHIVRHPFDVMSSTHLGTTDYVPLERYEAELANALDVLTDRPNTLMITFEDLVSRPDDIQERIVEFTGLGTRVPFRDFYKHADLPNDIVEAMHGLRPLDASRLHAWTRKPERREQYRDALARSDGTLARVADRFGYSLDLDSIQAPE